MNSAPGSNVVYFRMKDYSDYFICARPHCNSQNLDPSDFTVILPGNKTTPEVTYVGRSAATQTGDSINEVLLHFCAEAYAGHQLLQ